MLRILLKISSYIGRGLTVVSGRLSSVVASPFAVGMQMYNASTPEEIAQAILTCKIQDYDTQTRLVLKRRNALWQNWSGSSIPAGEPLAGYRIICLTHAVKRIWNDEETLFCR